MIFIKLFYLKTLSFSFSKSLATKYFLKSEKQI